MFSNFKFFVVGSAILPAIGVHYETFSDSSIGISNEERITKLDSLTVVSTCGLVNRITKEQFFWIATEMTRYQYLDEDFQNFVKSHEASDEFPYLDYCLFEKDGLEVQINVVCGNGWDCICRAFFDGTKCQSCDFCPPDEDTPSTYPNSLSHGVANCSDIRPDFPECTISCNGHDENFLSEVTGCGLMPTESAPKNVPMTSLPAGQDSGPTIGSDRGIRNDESTKTILIAGLSLVALSIVILATLLFVIRSKRRSRETEDDGSFPF